jgi:hypothetical protein
MDFTAETQAATSDVNITMILFIGILFILNFIVCRFLSIKLVNVGYVRKHPIIIIKTKKGLKSKPNTKVTTEEFKRLFFFWFVPIFGALSLIILYIAATSFITWKRVAPKLFLSHL